MFEKVYFFFEFLSGVWELYMFNMVFVIGCGVIVGEVVKIELLNSF